ncbi:MAG: hypothetical protein R3F61_25260 [Myxococcota bacterium]
MRPGAVERLTLAWFGDGGPLVVREGSGYRTVVVVWPTDSTGRLVAEAGLAKPDVRIWSFDTMTFDQLEWLIDTWQLEDHDVLVDAKGVWPCAQTLRSTEAYERVREAIERAVDELEEGPRS